MTSSTEQRLRVLIIDDDVKFRRLLRDYLRPFGMDLQEATDGISGIDRAMQEEFEAVILDRMLPGISGMEVLRRLGPDRRVPVLMLTARGEETDRVDGLEMGADDYVSKAASPREILARLRALTRRYQRVQRVSEREWFCVGNLRVDSAARTAFLRDARVSLTSFEFDLLLALARSAGTVCTREELLQQAAARSQNLFDRSIDVHVSSLRKKLADDPRDPEYIVTVRNVGYMLRKPEAK